MGKRRKDKKRMMIDKGPKSVKPLRVIDQEQQTQTVTFAGIGPQTITHVRLHTSSGEVLADVPVNKVMNTGDTVTIPSGVISFTPSAEEVKGCTVAYANGANIFYCGFDEGHDRMSIPDSQNKTLFDHGNVKYRVWWNADSQFHREGNPLSTHLDGTAEDMVFKSVDEILKDLTDPTEPDMINHPSHYGGEDNPYEAIKVIEAWGLGFALGNAVKYISRAGKKGTEIQDLEKASWYLARRIEQIQAGIADPELLG